MGRSSFRYFLTGGLLLCWACDNEPATDPGVRTDFPTARGTVEPAARTNGPGNASDASGPDTRTLPEVTLPTGSVEAVTSAQGGYGEEVIGYRGSPGNDSPGAGVSGGGGAAGLPAPAFSIMQPLDGETGNVPENPYAGADAPSTFSIDVDTASYTYSRASVDAGQLPQQDMVRVEEFVNYFDFHYAPPTGNDALSIYTELGECPWNTAHDLLLVGVTGRRLDFSSSPPANLVFLVDVSGSMADELDLMKAGLRSLSYVLREEDTLSIVTYAGSERVVLEAAKGEDREQILAAIDTLSSGGSTAGAAGIQRAYDIAQSHFIEGGTNRVLLLTDGDFNVGVSSTDDLADLIAEKRASAVFLSVFGFGMNSRGDAIAETLADNGNGIYVYIDSPAELKRALGHSLSGTLLTVATDVKLQVAFNPDLVKGYRLIGYENRLLTEDLFLEDLVDAGDLGAGLTSTALLEIVPADEAAPLPEPIPGTIPEPFSGATEEAGSGSVDSGKTDVETEASIDRGFAEVRVRYLPVGEETVEQRNLLVEPEDRRAVPTVKFLFAAGMSHFAMRLRGSQYLGAYDPARLVEELETALDFDDEGAVEEAVDFVRLAHSL